MRDSSSPARTTYDTTPATLGDLDIWGGRLVEMIDEAKEEIKAEFNSVISRISKRLDNHEARLSRMEDTLLDIQLVLKSIDKKLSKK